MSDSLWQTAVQYNVAQVLQIAMIGGPLPGMGPFRELRVISSNDLEEIRMRLSKIAATVKAQFHSVSSVDNTGYLSLAMCISISCRQLRNCVSLSVNVKPPPRVVILSGLNGDRPVSRNYCALSQLLA